MGRRRDVFMIQRVHIFGDLSQMGTDAEVEAEAKQIEEIEAAEQNDEDDAAQAERDHAEAVARGHKGLKKFK